MLCGEVKGVQDTVSSKRKVTIREMRILQKLLQQYGLSKAFLRFRKSRGTVGWSDLEKIL